MLGKIRIRSIAGVAMGIAIFISPGMGQKTSNPPGGSAPGGTGTRNGVGLPTTTGPNTDLNRGIYLAGKVMMEDGRPPAEPATIERVCNGSPRAQAYTDSKGNFNFQVGQIAGVLQDASEADQNAPGAPHALGMGRGSATGPSSTLNSANPLANCELRAALAGYRSDTVDLSNWRMFDNPDVGTIVLHRLGNVEGSVISVTSLQAPKGAKKAYDKAREALKKGKLPEAEKELRKAVEIYPQYAAAWCDLGRIQQHNKDTEQARRSYASALAADPKFTSPYLQLAELAVSAQKWSELADTTDRLLKLDPVDYPLMFLYNAVANLNLGRTDAAEKSARAGQKLDTAHKYPKLDRVMALVLERKKDYAGAAEQMRSYLQYGPATEDMARMKKELAELEARSGANQAATTQAPKIEPSGSGPPQPRQ